MAKQTFTTGQVLTAAQQNSLQANDFNQTVSVKTANYSLLAADKGTRIEFNTSGSVTCTVNSGQFDAGDTLIIQNRGAGTATITAGTATVNTSASLALAQYSAGTLYFVSDSAALFFGDAAGISASIVDAKGDLIVGTADNTVARLAVGTNGHTLVADSAEATGLKWAAASSGALTKITANTFSSVATVDIQGCFSATYLYYLVFVDVEPASFGGSFQMQFLYSTSSVQSAGYYASSFQYDRSNTLITSGTVNQASAKLLTYTGGSGSPSALSFTITNVGNSSELPLYWGNSVTWSQAIQSFAGGETGTARTYTGLRFFDSGNNITGNYKVYGVQN